ncbi:MAG TPA: YggT family protein [Mycobacteriales bacterium]|nr:YggT family protein [Mycobacteriales bacterium]
MIVAAILYWALTVFLVLLFLRLVFEYVFLLARSFTPSGAVAILLEIIYTATDPPLKALRKVLPPLRIGGISLDLAFLVLFIVVYILRNVAANAAV